MWGISKGVPTAGQQRLNKVQQKLSKVQQEPTVAQQDVIDLLFRHDFWSQGRGGGKSWLRWHIIQRLIEEDDKEYKYNAS